MRISRHRSEACRGSHGRSRSSHEASGSRAVVVVQHEANRLKTKQKEGRRRGAEGCGRADKERTRTNSARVGRSKRRRVSLPMVRIGREG